MMVKVDGNVVLSVVITVPRFIDYSANYYIAFKSVM